MCVCVCACVCFWLAILLHFHSQKNWPLTDEVLCKLAIRIPSSTLENIAITHLGIGVNVIKNLTKRYRDNIEAANRDLLIMWRNMNPETATREVSRFVSLIWQKILVNSCAELSSIRDKDCQHFCSGKKTLSRTQQLLMSLLNAHLYPNIPQSTLG